MKLDLNMKELSVIYKINEGNDERQDEIEKMIIKKGWSDFQAEDISDYLYKNLVFCYLYSFALDKYKKEDWWEELLDYEMDNLDKKVQNQLNYFSRSFIGMKKDLRDFIKNEINNWLDEYLEEGE